MKNKFFCIVIFFLFLIITLSSCGYYGYALNIKKYKEEYKSPYETEKNKKYQFEIILFKDKNIIKNFEIILTHCWYNINKKEYDSHICINYYKPDKKIKININKIKLIHIYNNAELKLKKANMTNLDKIENGFLIINKDIMGSFYYYKFYDIKSIPKKSIIEKIYLEFEIDNKIYKIEKTFNLDYKLHYTWFDLVMGI